jgi:hypothetical protein
MKKHYRQGDVLIQRVTSIPASAIVAKRIEGKIILAYGEATGHHHAIGETDSADWWKDGEVQFLEIPKTGATVTHQEHSPIALPPGKYRVTRQREYSPEAIRNVRD